MLKLMNRVAGEMAQELRTQCFPEDWSLVPSSRVWWFTMTNDPNCRGIMHRHRGVYTHTCPHTFRCKDTPTEARGQH